MGWTLAYTRLMHRTRYRKRAGRAMAHATGVYGPSPPLALVQQVWSPASGRSSWAVSGAIQVIQAELVEVDLGPDEIGEGPVWLADRAELATWMASDPGRCLAGGSRRGQLILPAVVRLVAQQTAGPLD